MDPICTGMMKYLAPSLAGQKQEWNRRFFVLFPQTPTSKARLDWYPSKSDYLKEPFVRKTIFIEEITDIGGNSFTGKINQFELTTLRKQVPYRFRVESKKELENWLSNLEKLIQECKQNVSATTPKGGECYLGAGVYSNELWSYDETPEEYPVTVGETESALVCKLTNRPLILQIYAQCFLLKDKKTDDVLYIWPYMYIRRYGKNNQSFTFEAGRSCASGQGVFIILSPESEEIFNHVHIAAKRISNRPPVPTRQYSHDDTEPPPAYDSLQPKSAPRKQQPIPSTKPVAKKPAAPRPLKTVPVSDDYSEPLMTQSPNSGGDQVYSSVDELRKVSLNIKDQAAGNNVYAEPVTQGVTSMSSVAMQIKANQISTSEDPGYDEVNFSALRLASKLATDKESDYGALYSEPQNKAAKSRSGK